MRGEEFVEVAADIDLDTMKYLTPKGQARVATLLLLKHMLDDTATDDAEAWILNTDGSDAKEGPTWECFESLGDLLLEALKKGRDGEANTLSLVIGFGTDLLDYEKYEKDYSKETD